MKRRPARAHLAEMTATAMVIATQFVIEAGHSPGRYELHIRDDKRLWKRIPAVGTQLGDVDGAPLLFGGLLDATTPPGTAALVTVVCKCGRVAEEVTAVEQGGDV